MEKTMKDRKFGWFAARNEYEMVEVKCYSCQTLNDVTLYFLVTETEEGRVRQSSWDPEDEHWYYDEAQSWLLGQNGKRYKLVENLKTGTKRIRGWHTTFGKRHMILRYWVYTDGINIIN